MLPCLRVRVLGRLSTRRSPSEAGDGQPSPNAAQSPVLSTGVTGRMFERLGCASELLADGGCSRSAGGVPRPLRAVPDRRASLTTSEAVRVSIWTRASPSRLSRPSQLVVCGSWLGQPLSKTCVSHGLNHARGPVSRTRMAKSNSTWRRAGAAANWQAPCAQDSSAPGTVFG